MRVALLALLLFPLALFARDPKYDRLVGHIETLTVTVSITPFDTMSRDPGGGLRSMLLYSGLTLIEPGARYPDGTPVSGAAQVSEKLMLRLLDVLDRPGLLKAAQVYYAERTIEPKGPPPAKTHITAYLGQGLRAKTCEVRLTIYEGDYYTDYIILPSWNEEVAPLLTALGRATAGSASEPLINDILKTYERFK